jgi:hypothetical protein
MQRDREVDEAGPGNIHFFNQLFSVLQAVQDHGGQIPGPLPLGGSQNKGKIGGEMAVVRAVRDFNDVFGQRGLFQFSL